MTTPAASWPDPFRALDPIGQSIAIILLGMSLLSWYVIFMRCGAYWRLRRRIRTALATFWAAPALFDGLERLRTIDPRHLLTPMVQHAVDHIHGPVGSHLARQVPDQDQLTRVLRQGLTDATLQLETGLTLLASIGSTAPFVGLLGTVWSIYRTMTHLGAGGAISMEQMAGPVGEALIMTAVGLAVAIPAVLAYNAFTRINRTVATDLDGFAHDLRAMLSTTQLADKARSA